MIPNFETLAEQVKIHREHKNLTQISLEAKLQGVTRSNISHLEQALRLPSKDILEKICRYLDMPEPYWKAFTNEKAILRSNFEVTLRELVGEPISALNLDSTVIENVETEIEHLFNELWTLEQAFDKFNSILVFYGIRSVTKDFFSRYLGNPAFTSIESFKGAIEKYLVDALRLFSSIPQAYEKLNTKELEILISPLKERSTEHYSQRTIWNRIKLIPNDKLSVLGYIAAAKVEKEKTEREEMVEFLHDIVKQKSERTFDLKNYTEKKKRKIDSLLRRYGSRIEHGLFSPLFQPDIDLIEREIKRLSPKDEGEILEMEKYQAMAYENLAHYLAADFMDVYVATSMRADADFISVNHFVNSLFDTADIKQYKLRYFNPTQSWIEDRVAKGLVEALMLKRASICIYMAQKEDTFGKDSEASVSLGQGKPVIVYVPRLFHEESKIDSEAFGLLQAKDLIDLIERSDKTALENIDQDDDQEAAHGVLLKVLLDRTTEESFIDIINIHWADFDLYGEVDKRFYKSEDEEKKINIKNWMDSIIKKGLDTRPTKDVKEALVQTLIANAMRYERRAKIFREVHPLALQVILSTGVLNGILVVRSIASCSKLLKALIDNKLDLELKVDENNYRLIEKNTKSTIRVISRHKLISNAFLTFYKQLE